MEPPPLRQGCAVVCTGAAPAAAAARAPAAAGLAEDAQLAEDLLARAGEGPEEVQRPRPVTLVPAAAAGLLRRGVGGHVAVVERARRGDRVDEPRGPRRAVHGDRQRSDLRVGRRPAPGPRTAWRG